MSDTLIQIPVTGGTLTVDETTLTAAVLASLSSATFSPSVTPPPPPPVVLKVVIAQDGVSPLPQDWSFAGKATLHDTTGGPQAPNTADVLFTTTSSFGGYQPSNNNGQTTDLTGCTHIRIDLKPTEAGQTYHLGCMKGGDTPLIGANGKAVQPLELPGNYGPAPVVGEWSTYVIPVADALTDYASGKPVVLTAIYKWMLQDASGSASNEIYIDNWGLV